MSRIQNISIIGSGNTATFLSNLLMGNGFNILQIISRNEVSGSLLATLVNAQFTKNYTIDSRSDLILICVPDNQIVNCIDELILPNSAIICHCAGSVNISVLDKFSQFGVLYPLQTLSKKQPIPSLEVPFLIEGNNEVTKQLLSDLIRKLGCNFQMVDSNSRLKYHLAAVFANNFTNAMLMAVDVLCKENQLDFDLFRPLIHRTFEKIEDLSPQDAQTGPAKRNDLETIEKHLLLLENRPELLSVYQVITNFIYSQQ